MKPGLRGLRTASKRRAWLRVPHSVTRVTALVLAVGAFGSCTSDERTPEVAAGSGYSEVARALGAMIEREREQKDLAAVSVALVDGDGVVWAAGFGEQAPGYLRDFAPDNRSGPAITLRQLMSHRSGLIREPPAGHYFDDTGTTLAATVASLAGQALVYEPASRTKYSNAGIAVAGYVLEATRGEPFADYVKGAVLIPLGMTTSAFTPAPEVADALARAYMWGFDRGRFDAPTFELGMAPAGSMYSTVLDLARFMGAMFRRGEGERGRILQAATLESMWEPQFADPGATEGYGLGFAVRERFGERWLGHGGAIYGFSTQLAFLPGAELGVAVVSAVDGTNAFTSRVADAALELMLAAKAGKPLPEAPLRGTDPIDPALARQLEGVYGTGDAALELDERNGRLYVTPSRGGSTAEVRTLGDTLIVDDRLAFGTRFLQDGIDLVVLGDPLQRRVRQPLRGRPAHPPAHWNGLIGEYGWDHNVLYVLEREGRLHALIEWFFLYPLEEVSRDVYAFPDRGLYPGEQLVFSRGPEDRATSVEAASVVFQRRNVGTEAGGTFRITPARPVEDLRAEALAASPPEEPGPFRDPELVEVTALEPGIRLDVRYATTNNFMSSVFYDQARVFLQRPAAEAVVRAHRRLAENGYGLLLHDGYRPWYVTKMFWDATPESQKIFVANPESGSRHNRGSAIDLNLYDLATGQPADMVGTYDEFSPRSFPNYPGGTSRQRWLRELLRRAMEAEGFSVYEAEWWHFDHEDWREYSLQNVTFDQLDGDPG